MSLEEFNLDHINAPRRVMAPVRWFGGKGNFAQNILPLLPKSKVYVEPFMGAASVFWALPEPYPVEVLNDLDGELVNLFRVLQSEELFAEFERRVIWTLYSVEELQKAIDTVGQGSEVERAWSFYVRLNQGFGGKPAGSRGDWGRAFVKKDDCADTTNCWRKRMKCLEIWHERLSRVQIENRDALECIRYWDTVETTLYLDPPYHHDTRAKGSTDVYAVEGDDGWHNELIDTIRNCKGCVILSGYDHQSYAPLLSDGWEIRKFDTASTVAGAKGKGKQLEQSPRTECIWINPAARRAMPQASLFDSTEVAG